MEEDRAILAVKAKYALSEVQAEKVRKYYRSKGAEYVAEKTAVVDQEKRPNVARSLLAALRDDWQPSRRTAAPAAKPPGKPVEPGELSGKFAAMKSAIRGRRGPAATGEAAVPVQD